MAMDPGGWHNSDVCQQSEERGACLGSMEERIFLENKNIFHVETEVPYLPVI